MNKWINDSCQDATTLYFHTLSRFLFKWNFSIIIHPSSFLSVFSDPEESIREQTTLIYTSDVKNVFIQYDTIQILLSAPHGGFSETMITTVTHTCLENILVWVLSKLNKIQHFTVSELSKESLDGCLNTTTWGYIRIYSRVSIILSVTEILLKCAPYINNIFPTHTLHMYNLV